MAPTTCPNCHADFLGEPIPEKNRQYFGNATHFLRVIGIYDRNLDRTTHWKCPDCNYEWPRGENPGV
jgi:rubrerythrin